MNKSIVKSENFRHCVTSMVFLRQWFNKWVAKCYWNLKKKTIENIDEGGTNISMRFLVRIDQIRESMVPQTFFGWQAFSKVSRF